MTYRIIPYKQGSKGAKALAVALGGRVLKLVGSSYHPSPGDVVINWGSTDLSQSTIGQWGGTLNKSTVIRNASNKKHFFEAIRSAGLDAIIPEFWTTASAIPADAYPVVCRTVLAGHSGEGIVIANSPADLVSAPLFVKYVKKKHEYRIHVGKDIAGSANKIIDSQMKRRRHGCPNPNWAIRNHANGFVYARENIVVPEKVLTAAQLTLAAIDLDFGAVDVIWNEAEQKAYVLEVNTAPGLEGQTVQNYANYFKLNGE